MKKFKKYFVLLLVVSIFCINNVKAGEKADELDKMVKSYINGEAVSGYQKDSRFNGYNIYYCKYVTNDATSAANIKYIFYSLKARKLMFIDAFLHNSNFSIKVSEGTWRELSENNGLMLKDAYYITQNLLKDAECPYLFPNYASGSKYSVCLSSTKDGCVGSKFHWINKQEDYDFRENAVYQSTNHISEGITKAVNSLRDSDLGKEIYQYEYDKMINAGKCVISNDENIENFNKRALEYYNNEVKKNIVYSTLKNPNPTSQTLPKMIINCDELGTKVSGSTCINYEISSKYQRGYKEIPGIVREIQAKAYLDCDKQLAVEYNEKKDQYTDCISENFGNESVCESLNAEYQNSINEKNLREEEEKSVNNETIEKLIDKFEIKPESEKSKGCNTFGENTTKIIKWVYNLIKIGSPILVVVLGILDFVKALLAGDDKGFKEAWQRFIKRLVAAVVVILLPVLITFILDISGVLKQYGIEGTGNEIYCIFK